VRLSWYLPASLLPGLAVRLGPASTGSPPVGYAEIQSASGDELSVSGGLGTGHGVGATVMVGE
jgi:hypothetical protein